FYVFDEWAADQDPSFKNIFYYELLPALIQRGKTVLVITHDEKYFGVASRIVKLDYGMIVSDTRMASHAGCSPNLAQNARPLSDLTAGFNTQHPVSEASK